jgi:hypothetical protein
MNEDDEKESKSASALTEARDFYFENGLLVLTAEYLRRRGYCCGNICRHCPYTKEEQMAASKKKFV